MVITNISHTITGKYFTIFSKTKFFGHYELQADLLRTIMIQRIYLMIIIYCQLIVFYLVHYLKVLIPTQLPFRNPMSFFNIKDT